MAWYGYKMTDPNELESRFSLENMLTYPSSEDNIEDSILEDRAEILKKVKEIINQLPDREADFVYLYFFLRKKQTDIAEIFKVSQPTVCYRLQRATARIQFLLQLPVVEQEVLRRDMEDFLTDPWDVDIMCQMYETTCQSAVAKNLGVSQGLVRHRFLRTLEKMKEMPNKKEYLEIFLLVSENLNILREVRRSTRIEPVICWI